MRQLLLLRPLRFTRRELLLLALGAASLSSCGVPAFAQDVRLSETFDTATPPSLPVGWTGDWLTSASSASSGSAANNLADTGTGLSTATSAEFSLEAAGAATLTYLARRTSSYPAEALTMVFVTAAGDFPVAGASGLPETPSAWLELTFAVPQGVLGSAAVRVRFDSAGGTSSGSNARIDDVAVTITAPEATGGTLGFATPVQEALAGTQGVLLPLALDWNGNESLSGMQFSLTHDAEAGAVLTGYVRGAALAEISAWTLTNEGANTLALSNGQTGLSAGTYDPLLYAAFDLADVTDTTVVTLQINGLVGATAVPDGTDAGLIAQPAGATLRILPRAALFEVADSLDVGSAPVGGSVSAPIWLHNRGTADLTLASIGTDSGAFSVTPAAVSLAPGDSAQASVTFQPTATDIGYVTASLLADGGTYTTLTATGTAAWGDATDDGAVDVGDIVLGVDVALGRVQPAITVQASLDVYPFPAGDGDVDVRDLTVLTQAVLRGQWPNAVALVTLQQAAGKATTGVQFVLDGSVLLVEIAQEVRGLQAEFLWAGGASRVGKAQIAQALDRLRVVWAPMDGGMLPMGLHPVADLGGGGGAVAAAATAEAKLLAGLAIGPTGERLTVSAAEIPRDAKLRPYPNPFSPLRDAALVLPTTQEVKVVDVLGREVWRGQGSWDGRTRSGNVVASGLYSIRAGTRSWPVVVIE